MLTKSCCPHNTIAVTQNYFETHIKLIYCRHHAPSETAGAGGEYFPGKPPYSPRLHCESDGNEQVRGDEVKGKLYICITCCYLFAQRGANEQVQGNGLLIS